MICASILKEAPAGTFLDGGAGRVNYEFAVPADN